MPECPVPQVCLDLWASALHVMELSCFRLNFLLQGVTFSPWTMLLKPSLFHGLQEKELKAVVVLQMLQSSVTALKLDCWQIACSYQMTFQPSKKIADCWDFVTLIYFSPTGSLLLFDCTKPPIWISSWCICQGAWEGWRPVFCFDQTEQR